MLRPVAISCDLDAWGISLDHAMEFYGEELFPAVGVDATEFALASYRHDVSDHLILSAITRVDWDDSHLYERVDWISKKEDGTPVCIKGVIQVSDIYMTHHINVIPEMYALSCDVECSFDKVRNLGGAMLEMAELRAAVVSMESKRLWQDPELSDVKLRIHKMLGNRNRDTNKFVIPKQALETPEETQEAFDSVFGAAR